ncbi:hypothetical protein LCGC14_1588820 [marine sediment metagenome]|uniref:Uncharacterized protein n=1 Tax=marine sediment metagenome TaxID=412755 RepID=A0A0F9IEN6_9ZZZZ
MSHNDNCKGLRNKFKCPHCSHGYMMEWAKNNHVKNCAWNDDVLGRKGE